MSISIPNYLVSELKWPIGGMGEGAGPFEEGLEVRGGFENKLAALFVRGLWWSVDFGSRGGFKEDL